MPVTLYSAASFGVERALPGRRSGEALESAMLTAITEELMRH